ncbi:MAG: response regulator, partial [bacterium]
MRNRIIVADDSITVQKVIKLILSPRGYEIESYMNGKDAYNAIKRHLPSLVIADAVMPEMNGIELGEAMKKEKKEISSIPLILLHSSFEDIKPEDAIKSGAKGKLTKPFEDKQLVEMVEKYVTQEEEVDAACSTWDMESFVRPEMPDIKNPIKTIVKNGGDIEVEVDLDETNRDDKTPIFRITADEKIEDLGIPDADKFTRPKKEEPVLEDEEEEFGPEVISDDEAQKLMEEFKIKENDDGTINFDDMESNIEDATKKALEKIEKLDEGFKPEQDIGLWSERYYEHAQVPASSSTDDSLLLDAGEDDVPQVNSGEITDDKDLIKAITKEIV